MIGIIVTTDNDVYAQDFGAPLHKTIGGVVGGPIEVVHPRGLNRPYCMIVNEEGLLKDLPWNDVGSYLYQTHIHGHPIVGNIVIMKIGLTGGGPDIVGLDKDEAEMYLSLLTKLFGLKMKGDSK